MLPPLCVGVQSLGIRQENERPQASSNRTWLPRILERFELRWDDLSLFLKERKQRYCRFEIGFGT